MTLRTILFSSCLLLLTSNYTNGQKPTGLECPSLDNGDSYTQSEFLSRLANECRYDRLLLPTYNTRDTVYVHASSYVYFIQPAEAHDLNFKLHFLLQLRWVDKRLAYYRFSPKRINIIGENDLRDRIWVPHLYMSNEQSSSLMGTDSKDVLISVAPDGEVVFSRRMQAVLYCWMNLQKFPFDEQTCSMNLESWKYNASILRLMWEKDIPPVRLSPELHLTEYSLIDFWTNESVVRGDIASMRLIGGRSGNYSALKFTFKLGREVGYYLMDYFIPSMMIVAMSWVTFWLQADASAPRITLGTSTMLSFITLASSQSKTLPKVSYIKASEIWFLGCIGFIFSALVEFAFVNTIWRRKKVVSLKKVNSKYILKSTLTPRLARKELQKELQETSPQLSKSRSCSSLNQDTSSDPSGPAYNNYLTVHSFPSAMNLPTITTQSYDDLIQGPGGTRKPPAPNGNGSDGSDEPPHHHTWTQMTPQEIATWIDKRSRVMFPVLFIFFNIIYWTFVYCL
ncbi:pH-sensitive chloride channel 2 isoform X1 [Amyelois transitella]|uniref:pH-sensitive chloride channel 2 isoform X1 n=1 Tax=Amyelois transitella TaxID=680683 RepID=UPI00067BFB52|nr:pH-sensitive chloride channel 2 isoform X1 [Amyelois transitella]